MLEQLEKLQFALDRAVERRARKEASSYGRRSFLSKVGAALVGTALVPMLPFKALVFATEMRGTVLTAELKRSEP